MIVALDFDGTYTEDPEAWDAVILALRTKGHQVIVCTMRHEHEDEAVRRQLAGKVDRIVFTGRKAKARHTRFLGIEVDVWIDDKPVWILYDAA